MKFLSTRILATPQAFALISDPINGGDHRAVRRAVELATDPNPSRKTDYLIQGSPLSIAAKWAHREGEETVLIIYGKGEMGRIPELEKDCIPIPLE